MQPVSNADRLVLLLRQKLQERGLAARGGAKERGTVAGEPSGVRALAAAEGIGEPPLRRAFVQTLLADQLGPAFLNDARFQQVVTDVGAAIDDDPKARALLSRLIKDLRNSSGA